MWPRLLRIVFGEPALLVEHAAAYSALIEQEAVRWQAAFIRRLSFLFVLGAAILLALVFAGVALMLHAVTDVSHWMLWLVPVLPLFVAVIAAWGLWRNTSDCSAFSRVRAQLAADLQLLDWKEPQ